MRVQNFFTDDDRQRIEGAVRQAETRTAGEIVPYIVARCDDYEEALWKSATLGALAAVVAALGAYHWLEIWGVPLWMWMALPPLAGGAVGYLLPALLPAVRRFLVPEERRVQRARQRAETAFLEEEVFDTRDRTGILLFLALFEHQVVVLGDSGINAAVPAGAWEEIVAEMVAGIRAGQPAAALEEGVERCGALLEAHRVERRDDDVDELSDQLRLRER